MGLWQEKGLATLGAWVLLTATAQAGVGAAGGRLLHQRCAGATGCEVTVQVDGSGSDRCGISMRHVLVIGTGVDEVSWQLKATGSAKLDDYAFGTTKEVYTNGVVVDHNDDGAAELPGDPAGPHTVFRKPQPDAKGQRLTLTVDADGRRRMKAYLYTVNVQRRNSSGQWVRCRAHDPIIFSRGD